MDLKEVNRELITAEPQKILDWALQSFPYQIAMTTSFQVSGTVLLHMIRDKTFDFPVFFIDTGFHFPETIAFKNRLVREWKLNIHTIIPSMSRKEQRKKYGPFLYERNPDLCCKINKVIPLSHLKKEIGVKKWISAVRKDQGKGRKQLKPVMEDTEKGLRIHPLYNWTWEKIWSYVRENDLPYHPLYDKGYTSIGCFPPSCTGKNEISEGERAGRWRGRQKTECGLHTGLKTGSE
ncbi:MAG: phosphoadenylyl-sulfate reductase [Candidatus Aminicenantes bacterium]|nr:phosphoadenylyl-sulfate reductase [Candidatus Aminicenantes bacterium]